MKFKLKTLIYFQIYFILINRFLISEFHFPEVIKYVPDFITIILTIYLFCDQFKGKILIAKEQRILNNIILVLFIYSVVSSIIHFTKPLYFIWALRVTFRFYLFYVACINYLRKDDVEKILRGFEKAFLLNIILSFYQFFIQGYKLDNLGGIFGTESGCNGYLNIFFVIIIVYEISKYFSKEIKLMKLLYYLIFALIISSMAEIKFFYAEIIIIIGLVIILNKPNRRTIGFVIVTLIGIIIGLQALKQIFPESYKLLFSTESVTNYLGAVGWSQGIRIARTTAIPIINEYFFDNNILKYLFGFGFGNCEQSSFFITPFAEQYAYTNYRNFTYAMQYIETGIIGLIIYVSFFVENLILIIRNKSLRFLSKWKNFLIIFSLMMIINMWYGDTCKSDIAYLSYFCLAIFGVLIKNYKETS